MDKQKYNGYINVLKGINPITHRRIMFGTVTYKKLLHEYQIPELKYLSGK
jgi:hypothetical protein